MNHSQDMEQDNIIEATRTKTVVKNSIAGSGKPQPCHIEWPIYYTTIGMSYRTKFLY